MRAGVVRDKMKMEKKWPTDHPLDQASMSEESLVSEQMGEGEHRILILKMCFGCGELTIVPWVTEIVTSEGEPRYVCTKCWRE